MTPLRIFTATLLALCFAAPALTQPPPVPDYSGTWTLDSTLQIPDEMGPCVFTGSAEIQQMGTALSGNAVQTLTGGPAACPPMMMASLTGEVDMMGCVTLGALSGPLGSAFFTGCPGNMELTLVGDVAVETGPFSGSDGDWSAALEADLLAIPTLSTVGLVALALLLLAVGTWVMRRRVRVS